MMAAEVRNTADAKAYFANERTFLHWLSVAVTLGGLASGLLGVSGHVHKHYATGFHLSAIAVRLFALFALGLSILLAISAAYNFHTRREMLNRILDGPYSTLSLPLVYGAIMVVSFLFALSGAIAGLVQGP